MKFEDEIAGQVKLLESRATNVNDPALKGIIEILKGIRNIDDLQESAALIQRIIIDSVEDMRNCEELSEFIERQKKKRH